MRFVTQARLCDETIPDEIALAARLRDWSEFQEARVHGVTGHHDARIQTLDGIEDDAFGDSAVGYGMRQRPGGIPTSRGSNWSLTGSPTTAPELRNSGMR